MEYICGSSSKMKNLIKYLLYFVACSANAEVPWTSEIYNSYFNQCKSSMLQQKMTEQRANGVCYCLSSAFSKEFGMEQYDYLRSAQPNPNGNIYDKKLYKIMTNCMK
jgi:hypothetical protein